MSSLIKLRRVTLLRGKRKILRNIDWAVQKGEHWFILGHNGSGKTSLLEIVLGYIWASEGTVEILGERYGKTQIPELRRKIGYVAPWIQKHIKPKETVFEAVASGLRATIGFYDYVTPEVTKAVHQALKAMELLAFKEAAFGRLSSGEQLKVLIARALIHTPKILILDEPFSALDIGSRLKVQNLIEKLGHYHQKPSIILVTHHFDDITALYTHGLILKQGQIYKQGPKNAVLNRKVIARAMNIRLDSILDLY